MSSRFRREHWWLRAWLMVVGYCTFACALDERVVEGWRLLGPSERTRNCAPGWAYVDHDGALQIFMQDAVPELAAGATALVPFGEHAWLRAVTHPDGEFARANQLQRSSGLGQPFTPIEPSGVAVAIAGEELLVAIRGGQDLASSSRLDRWTTAGERVEVGPGWLYLRVVGMTVVDERPFLLAFIALDHDNARLQLLSVDADHSLRFEHELPLDFYFDEFNQPLTGAQLIHHQGSFYLAARGETLLRVRQTAGTVGEAVYETAAVVARSCTTVRRRPAARSLDPLEARWHEHAPPQPSVPLATAKALRAGGVELDPASRVAWPTPAFDDADAVVPLLASLGPGWTLVTRFAGRSIDWRSRLPEHWTIQSY